MSGPLRGIDTNVLLRLLTRDDAGQARLAEQLIGEVDGRREFYIDTIVLLETVWALSSRYGVPRQSVLDTIGGLLASDEFEFDNRDAVELALGYAERRGLGFADALIATRNASAGCETTLTFDRDAAKRIPGMDLIA